MPEASANKEERRNRILETLENILDDDRSPQPERDAAQSRWEHITGEKWTGKKKQKQSSSTYGKQPPKNPFYDADFSGFSGFESKFWEDIFGNRSRNSDNHSNASYNYKRDHAYGTRSDQYKQTENDYSKYGREWGVNQCTDKQFNFIDAICMFFRWKHPDQIYISFQEASSFIDKYSKIYNMFNYQNRNFASLQELFRVLGIKWSETERTYKWEYEKKGGIL